MAFPPAPRPPADRWSTSSKEGIVTLEVTLHEDEEPQWAEWELWRNTDVGSDREQSAWIAHGTAPSFLAAIDAAVDAFSDGGQRGQG